jgi:iron complex transport system substrate-binding protein
VVLSVAAALVMSGCGGDEGGDANGGTTAIETPGLPATHTGADGVTSTVEDASRIVTLSGEFTEIVFALGLGPNVVGVDLSSVYPKAETAPIPKIGVERRLLAEPILAREPTVVIGDVDATPVEVIDQVRQAGVPVIIFPRFQGLDAPSAKIRAVAEVLGIPSRGEQLAAEVQAEIDEVVARAAGVDERPPAAVVYLANQGETILLLGDNTVMEGLIAAAGGEDVAPAAGADGMMPLTPEALAAGAPEWIITTDRGLSATGGEQGFLELPGVAQTPAADAGNVLVFEDTYLLNLGPRTPDLLRDLLEAFHPELAAQ